MAATSSALRLTGSPISLAASSTAVFVNATTTQLEISDRIFAMGDEITSFISDATIDLVSGALRVVDVVCTGCLGTTEIAGLDVSDDTNLAAGRSLTLSGDSVEADAELFTDSRTFNYASSSLATSTKPVLQWLVPQAATISTITCWDVDNSPAGTSTVMFEERTSPNTAGTDVLYANGLTAGSGNATASSTLSNSTLAAGSYLTMLIEGYLIGTPDFPVCDIRYVFDD